MKKIIAIALISLLSKTAIAAPPPVPSISGPNTSTSGTYTLTWQSNGAARYVLQGEGAGTIYNGTANSTVRINTNGVYSYKVKACDSSGYASGCSNYSNTISVTVNIPAPPPVPSISGPSTSTSGTYTLTWQSNNAARYVLQGEGAGTIYNGTENSTVRTNTNGVYSYKVKACDSSGYASGCSNYSNTISVTVNIPSQNQSPIAKADTLTSEKYGPEVCINVLDNDSDPDHDNIYVSDVWSADNGITRLNNGKACYRPNKDFHGSDSFSYTINDGRGKTSTALVDVDVKPWQIYIKATENSNTPITSSKTGDYVVSWLSVPGAEYYELTGETRGVIARTEKEKLHVRRKVVGTELNNYAYKVKACTNSGVCIDNSDTKSVIVGLGKTTTNSFITNIYLNKDRYNNCPEYTDYTCEEYDEDLCICSKQNEEYGGTVKFSDAVSFTAQARTNDTDSCSNIGYDPHSCNRADIFKRITETALNRKIKIEFTLKVLDYDWHSETNLWWIVFQDHINTGGDGNPPLSALVISRKGEDKLVFKHEYRDCLWGVIEYGENKDLCVDNPATNVPTHEVIVAERNPADGSTTPNYHRITIEINEGDGTEDAGMKVTIGDTQLSDAKYQVRSKIISEQQHSYGFGIYHSYDKSNLQGVGQKLEAIVEDLDILETTNK